jgi:hypothetical protein
MDCRTPSEAPFLPPAGTRSYFVDDFRAGFISVLSESRKLALESVKRSQDHYKKKTMITGPPPLLFKLDTRFL